MCLTLVVFQPVGGFEDLILLGNLVPGVTPLAGTLSSLHFCFQ